MKRWTRVLRKSPGLFIAQVCLQSNVFVVLQTIIFFLLINLLHIFIIVVSPKKERPFFHKPPFFFFVLRIYSLRQEATVRELSVGTAYDVGCKVCSYLSALYPNHSTRRE